MVFTNAPISVKSRLRSRASRVNPAGSRRDVETVSLNHAKNQRGSRRRRRQDGGSLPNRPDDINVDVICTFHRGEEGFNVISSIKTDIYYRLGWLWFAAISKWTQDYGQTRSTFQNKPQVSFSNIRPVPTGSPARSLHVPTI